MNAIAPGFIDTELTQGLGSERVRKSPNAAHCDGYSELDDIPPMAKHLLGEGGRNAAESPFTIDAG